MNTRLPVSKFLLIDLEATCWEDKEYQNEKSQILEIGVVEVDIQKKHIGKKKGFLIKPNNTYISSYCEKLTGINQELLNNHAIGLEEAFIQISQEYPDAKEIVWGGWGRDQEFLKRAIKEYKECYQKEITLPFSENYMDFQWMYSFIRGKESVISLKAALEEENLEFVDGTQHRAVPDALNSARVILSLLTRIEYFTK